MSVRLNPVDYAMQSNGTSPSSAPSSNLTMGFEGCLLEDGEGCAYNWPVLFLFLIVIAAIVGNILVCLAVKQERKLQNMFNFFLVSLALSDLMSATLVMPLSIIKALIGESP